MSSGSTVDGQAVAVVDACRRALPASPSGGSVTFGFDGYVDTVRELRSDTGDGTDRVETLELVGERIREAVEADSSLSFGWTTNGRRAGGHVCHLGRASDELGYEPTLIGTLGTPVRPIFEESFGHLDVHSLGEPGRTDAVEFDDGKLLLAESGDVGALDWASLLETVDRGTLVDALDGAQLFGIGYWAMLPGLPEILDGLRERVWPALDDPPAHLLVDPADVRQVSPAAVEAVADATSRFATGTDATTVTVSANRVETKSLSEILCGGSSGDALANARRLFDALDVDRVVSHGVDASCRVSDAGEVTVPVATVEDPVLSTSAGDHFNAGYAVGLIETLPPGAPLVTGNAYAREFVATGRTPDFDDLVAAVDGYLDQFE